MLFLYRLKGYLCFYLFRSFCWSIDVISLLNFRGWNTVVFFPPRNTEKFFTCSFNPLLHFALRTQWISSEQFWMDPRCWMWLCCFIYLVLWSNLISSCVHVQPEVWLLLLLATLQFPYSLIWLYIQGGDFFFLHWMPEMGVLLVISHSLCNLSLYPNAYSEVPNKDISCFLTSFLTCLTWQPQLFYFHLYFRTFLNLKWFYF